MTDSPLRVEELNLGEKMPWRARGVLRRARRRSKTGVVVYADIWESPRSMAFDTSIVSVREHGERLCLRSRNTKRATFCALSPGHHELTFQVARPKNGSSFIREVDLAPGDVLIALSYPIQPKILFKPKLTEDRWRLGILRTRG